VKDIKIKKKDTIKSLCDQITPENCYGEVYWGKPVGKEILPEYTIRKKKVNPKKI